MVFVWGLGVFGDAWLSVVKFCECCEVVCVWMFLGEVADGVFGKV